MEVQQADRISQARQYWMAAVRANNRLREYPGESGTARSLERYKAEVRAFAGEVCRPGDGNPLAAVA
jgi:hypothetical protein